MQCPPHTGVRPAPGAASVAVLDEARLEQGLQRVVLHTVTKGRGSTTRTLGSWMVK
jgi:xanthine/CO dehydrogenase XdhC/CoxF family maturation factor